MKTFKQHRKIKYITLPLILLAIIMGFSIQGRAQSGSKNELLKMIEDDRTTVDAIAGYDGRVRSDILQVAQTPEVLDKIEELQKRSQNQFRTIINDYDRDAQTAFYDMARYPNLIADLVSDGKPSSSEVNAIVSRYPEDIHETAKKYARMYFDVLLSINLLNNEIDREFQIYLEPYDPQTRESVKALIAYPEIVSILVEDKDFTALLGEVYNEDPQWVEGNLNKISQELAEQNKEDLDAYKNQIQNDPEAYNEMLEAADKFARENNEAREESSSDPIVEVRVINSYPYWFGYPYWYSDPYWRPYPLYYHTGFYRNHYGNIVFVGLPSYHFIHWQTYNHPTLYPHLSYNYYSYYENHYVNRYRDANRPIPHSRFYRSIESNVVNNPRVNNSNLERIDHQRGSNIVRRPNTFESGSAGRGNSGYTRQRDYSNSRPESGTSGTVNRRGNESINRGGNNQGSYENKGGAVNRREYNITNPRRSEGSINRRGSGIGSGTIRRESSPSNANPAGNSYQRPQREATLNRSSNENPRFNQSNNARVRDNNSPSVNRQRTSSDNNGNRASARDASQVQRSAVQERSTRRLEQRESRAVNRSSGRTEVREKKASVASSGNSNRERGNGRQR
ncbi:MAG TPA: hypothetical protein VGK38_03560 [Prolixibacteraceae bacterium]